MAKNNIAQTKLFVIEVYPCTYAWCARGRSGNQSYCDGSHKGFEFSPVIEKAEHIKRVA